VNRFRRLSANGVFLGPRIIPDYLAILHDEANSLQLANVGQRIPGHGHEIREFTGLNCPTASTRSIRRGRRARSSSNMRDGVARAQAQWLTLSSNARQLFTDQSSEYIPFDQPDSVIDAIREVYAQST
jgi:hypothetical protein